MGRHGRAARAPRRGGFSARPQKTAGDLYLRAGNYLYTAERFILPGAEKRRAGEQAYRCYHAGIRLRYPQIEFVEVPYAGVSLPALFLRGEGEDGPAPTVVIVNGMDNAKEMSIFFAGLEFARRGFNTLAIDGPGQGETLRIRGIHSRYDYEVPGKRGGPEAGRHHGLQLRRLLFLAHRSV
jgi:hypothetical protein